MVKWWYFLPFLLADSESLLVLPCPRKDRHIHLSKESFFKARLLILGHILGFLWSTGSTGSHWTRSPKFSHIFLCWLYIITFLLLYRLNIYIKLSNNFAASTFPNVNCSKYKITQTRKGTTCLVIPTPNIINQDGAAQINDSRLGARCLVHRVCIRAKLCLTFLGWRNYAAANMGQVVMGSITSKQNRWVERSEFGTRHGQPKANRYCYLNSLRSMEKRCELEN